jgi:hypothetical protein
MLKTESVESSCHFCTDVVRDDQYCTGCGHFVCPKCDKSEGTLSKRSAHLVNDHQYSLEAWE